VILDAGFLVSVDRGERAAQEFLTAALRRRTPLSTTHPVVAQVWRSGTRQARLAKFLRGIAVHPLGDGREVGAILSRSGTADVVDAHLVSVAIRLAEPILTADVDDLDVLTASLPDLRPRVLAWP
jgi:hypothetical protein